MNADTDIRAAARAAAQTVTTELSPHIDKLAEDLRALVSDAEVLLKQVQSLSGDAAAAARVQLERKMGEVRAKLETMRAAASEQARWAVESTEGFVRREPIKALGLAAAAGLIVGILIARR
jgi:ElaB/YqjD/DUF883 family membrane-anchored ribosome-binding protein